MAQRIDLLNTVRYLGNSEGLTSSQSQTKNWRRCKWPLILLAVHLLISSPTYAERASPFQIGALTNSWGGSPHIEGLRSGLAELGYRENRDFELGIRFTRGKRQALQKAASDLVKAGADIIFTDSVLTTQAAQQATTEIPIIFSGVEDPVGSGLIKSYARPGGNITGVSSLDVELAPKRLQVFLELLPTLNRALFVYEAADIYPSKAAELLKRAAHRLGIELVQRTVSTQDEVKTLFSQLDDLKIDGILAPSCCLLNISGLILELHEKIPTMFHTAGFWIKKGGLASYGPDMYISGRQSARIVDKIIKGAEPAKTPVEVNSDIKFFINLKTANTLGIVIPPKILIRAHHVVR